MRLGIFWTSGLAWKNDPIHRERWGSWWLSGCLFYSNDGIFMYFQRTWLIIGVCDRDGSNMIPHSRGDASIKTTHFRCFFFKKHTYFQYMLLDFYVHQDNRAGTHHPIAFICSKWRWGLSPRLEITLVENRKHVNYIYILT